MPTIQVASNAAVLEPLLLAQKVTDVLAEYARVPKEHVHVQVQGDQFMSFGNDASTPACQATCHHFLSSNQARDT